MAGHFNFSCVGLFPSHIAGLQTLIELDSSDGTCQVLQGFLTGSAPFMNPLFPVSLSDRTAVLKAWVERKRFAYRDSSPGPIPSGWVKLSGEGEPCGFVPGPVFTKGMSDFRAFLRHFHADSGGVPLLFFTGAALNHDGFRIEVMTAAVHVSAEGERGLVNGMHYLERELADHGGPWLQPGVTERVPTLMTRWSEGIFVPSHQTAEDPGFFSDAYLGLMGHFGANALKMPLSIYDFWRSDALPELNAENVDARLETLRAHAARLKDRGISLFLILKAGTRPSTHPVFLNHPEVLGAKDEIFMEELSGADRRVLCTSQPLVQEAHREVLTFLFGQVPELAGAIVIVGGEGFRHCFMRPAGEEPTNCPHCHGHDAHERVAALVNNLREGVAAVGHRQRLLAWPYSAFVWSRDDETESRWIRHLDSGVEVLSNFDCGDADPAHPEGGRLFDYNLRITGPSRCYAAQAAACRERGIPMLAKTETNTTPDTFFLPYLPLYFRWHARFNAIREAGAAGFMGQWRFYGMSGSLPEELQYHSVWNPQRSTESLLATVARRDFGLNPEGAAQAVEGWRQMDTAWTTFPYSAMTSGESEAYMRGPWYLGPAHPLVFNEQNDYQLPASFFKRRGDLGEMLSKEAIERLPRKPRYVCNLFFCLPFGVDAYLKLARKCRDDWDAGLAILEAALGPNPNPCAVLERNICQTISIHLHTLVHTVEFFRCRARLSGEPVRADGFRSLLADLDAILEGEIINAQRAIPILRDDPRIGYGFTYGAVYDLEMVEAKIRQCRFVKETELPRISSLIRFHVWLQYP